MYVYICMYVYVVYVYVCMYVCSVCMCVCSGVCTCVISIITLLASSRELCCQRQHSTVTNNIPVVSNSLMLHFRITNNIIPKDMHSMLSAVSHDPQTMLMCDEITFPPLSHCM